MTTICIVAENSVQADMLHAFISELVNAQVMTMRDRIIETDKSRLVIQVFSDDAGRGMTNVFIIQRRRT